MDLSKEGIKKEIEAKKKRLEELKAKRAARKADGPATAGPAADSSGRGGPPSAGGDDASALLAGVSAVMQGSGTRAGRAPPKLVAAAQAPISIDPVEKHNYDKSEQCDLGGPVLSGKDGEAQKALAEERIKLEEKEVKLKALMKQVKEDKIKYDHLRQEAELAEFKEMDPAEAKAIMESSQFMDWFHKATKMVERTLGQGYDPTVDYGGSEGDGKGSSSQMLFERATFKDERKTQQRAVTTINWSQKFPELMLSAYAGQEDEMSLEPDGTVLVWNLHLANRPEYYFYCNSTVLSAQFHPSNPKLIVAGCKSGQVVIWDTREKSSPVNRTSLSNGHVAPVYSVATLPVVNKFHNIVSVSTDGHLCVWSDNNLHDPSTELHLTYGKEEITTTCFDFAGRETNSLVLGSDEGSLYKARIYDNNNGIYEAVDKAHDAPITNISFHPYTKNAPSTVSDLFLTSSYDWTVKLWSNKTSRPLFTFESARDYVYDVQWSPVHPAVFAMGDGTGRLDLWNLNQYTDVPVQTVQVTDPSHSGLEKAAINAVRFSDDGKHVAAGTSTGAIHVYGVHSTLYDPNDDASKFYEVMHKKATSST